MQPSQQRVRVLRAFYFKSEPLPADSVCVLPRGFALEMRSAHKVEFLHDDEPAPAPARKKTEG